MSLAFALKWPTRNLFGAVLRTPAERHVVSRLLQDSFRTHWAAYGMAIASMCVVAATTAATAWLMRDVTDQFIVGKEIGLVYTLAATVAGIFVVKGIATFLQDVTLSRAGNSIIAERQRQLYDRILSQGLEFFHGFSSSDLITRLTQNAQAARNVVDLLVTSFFRDLFSLLGLVAVMVYQQPLLSLVAIICGPIAVFGVRVLMKRVRRLMAMEFMSLAQIVQVLQETVFGVRVVKSFNLEDLMRTRMDRAIADVQARANGVAAIEAATSPIMETLAGFAIAGVILVSGHLVTSGGHTPGEIMSFITALLLAYDPGRRLAKTRVALEGGLVGVRLMYEMIDRTPRMTDAPSAAVLNGGEGRIEFHGVSFGYRDNERVLRDLSLVFRPGEMTALVGSSGAGKSTILNLILRLYDPNGGSVTIDGQDLRRVTARSLRNRIAYVGQDTFLFAGTIADNIRMGCQDAGDERVIAAAREANAHQFIAALPMGYDTPVGENGLFLSGGQRQRISIARAILKNSQILLLDEATSALDAESEALFRDALMKLKIDRTIIVIAHRLSTVHQADRIMLIRDGQLAEAGTHSELIKTDGAYRKLYEYQLIP